jgi:HSP20 family protein
MAISRFRHTPNRPLGPFEQLQREINQLFDVDYPRESRGLFDRSSSPSIDVVEETDDFKVYCDLPGVDGKDLDISIANNVLTIKGEKKNPSSDQSSQVYRCETWTGSFQRTLSLPTSVDSSKIEANLKDGVLVVTLPKREEVKPRHIDVAIK